MRTILQLTACLLAGACADENPSDVATRARLQAMSPDAGAPIGAVGPPGDDNSARGGLDPAPGSKVVVPESGASHPDVGGAAFRGALFVSHRAPDGRIVVSRRSGTAWSRQILPEYTTGGTSLAEWNGHLYLAWLGTDSSHRLNVMRTADGVTWTDKWTVGGAHMQTPALIVYGERLNAFVGIDRPDDADSGVEQYVFHAGGLDWHAPLPPPITLGVGGSPSATVHRNELWLAWRSPDNQMLLRRFVPGVGWQANIATQLRENASIFTANTAPSTLVLIGRGDEPTGRGGRIGFRYSGDGQSFQLAGVANAWTHGRPLGVGFQGRTTIEFAFTGTDPDQSVNVETFNLGGASPADRPTDVKIDWVMPQRTYGPRCYGDLVPPREFVAPSRWPLTINACTAKPGGSPIDHYEWRITHPDGKIQNLSSKTCQIDVEVPRLGTYPTSVSVLAANGASTSAQRDVVVKDLLVVAIGDSVGSGEGTPEAYCAKSERDCTAVWNDIHCHRSWKSGAAVAAIALELADPHSSVTFVSTACTGSTVAAQPNGESLLGVQGQLARVDTLVDGREVDAVVVYGGGNDIGFRPILEECATPYARCDLAFNFVVDVESRIKDQLPGAYDDLAGQIRSRLSPAHTFIGEYPTTVRGSGGEFCHVTFERAAAMQYPWLPHPLRDVDGDITPEESQWAEQEVVSPLNEEIRKAAARHGWTAVPIQSGFATHGYCANEGWIRRWMESWSGQGDERGTMHPNEAGHQYIGERFFAAMRPALLGPSDWVHHRTADRFIDRMCPRPCGTHCQENLNACQAGCGVFVDPSACRAACARVNDHCRATCG